MLLEIFTNSADEDQALSTLHTLISEEALKQLQSEYKRSKLLSHLTFGKKHKKYKTLKRQLRDKLKNIKS